MPHRLKVAALVMLLLALVACGCASVAPGNDPVVVHAERTLGAADVLYAAAMRYYFTPGVASNLSPPVARVFEAVRVGYDEPYKDVQTALDTYKSVRTALARDALRGKESTLAKVVNPVAAVLPNAPPLVAVEVP